MLFIIGFFAMAGLIFMANDWLKAYNARTAEILRNHRGY